MKSWLVVVFLQVVIVDLAVSYEHSPVDEPIVDLAAPEVFSALFYINNYPDLFKAGIQDIDAAKTHWLEYGIEEGRQGSGSFHSLQYFLRYPHLEWILDKNKTEAVIHYLTKGKSLGYVGYVEHGYKGRWTISDGKGIFVSASARMGGAVDSLVWNNKEFLNSRNHGRQLQMAFSLEPHGDCVKANEAGSALDGDSPRTTSILRAIHSRGNLLGSMEFPAFYLSSMTPDIDKLCDPDKLPPDDQTVYAHAFTKQVIIGCGRVDHCIKVMTSFSVVPADLSPSYTAVRFEAPAVSLAGDFTEFYTYNIIGHQSQRYHISRWPLILTTQDHQYAMGVFAPYGQDTDTFQSYDIHSFTNSSYPNNTNQFKVIFRKNYLHGEDRKAMYLAYLVYLCVGNLPIVENCLYEITRYPHILVK